MHSAPITVWMSTTPRRISERAITTGAAPTSSALSRNSTPSALSKRRDPDAGAATNADRDDDDREPPQAGADRRRRERGEQASRPGASTAAKGTQSPVGADARNTYVDEQEQQHDAETGHRARRRSSGVCRPLRTAVTPAAPGRSCALARYEIVPTGTHGMTRPQWWNDSPGSAGSGPPSASGTSTTRLEVVDEEVGEVLR